MKRGNILINVSNEPLLLLMANRTRREQGYRLLNPLRRCFRHEPKHVKQYTRRIRDTVSWEGKHHASEESLRQLFSIALQ